uniref:Uncharacterized protein n=1 Tax=Moniliophthora roreri TaxID=221103 RepID=A0A0W0F6B4_MONRR
MSNILASSIPLCSKCNNTFSVSESHTYPPVSMNDFRSNVVPSTDDHARTSKIIADEESVGTGEVDSSDADYTPKELYLFAKETPE